MSSIASNSKASPRQNALEKPERNDLAKSKTKSTVVQVCRESIDFNFKFYKISTLLQRVEVKIITDTPKNGGQNKTTKVIFSNSTLSESDSDQYYNKFDCIEND